MDIDAQTLAIPIGDIEFEGALDEVAGLAGTWLLDHFAAAHGKEAS